MSERSNEYFALLRGCSARRARFTDFGVTARFNVRAGCSRVALREERINERRSPYGRR